MPLPQYLPHVIYSVALTSVSMHLLFQRKANDEQRAHTNAQISILESIVHRIQTDKNISDDEIERLQKLARTQKGSDDLEPAVSSEGVGWKDVIMGTKRREPGGLSDWDRKDLEKLRREMESSR